MGPSKILTISPNDNTIVVERNEPSEEELAETLKKSEAAFHSFKGKLNLDARKVVIKKALDILDSKKDELAMELTVQMGRPIAYAAKEIQTAISRSYYLLSIVEPILLPTPGTSQDGFKRYIRKEPVGQVLIIFAWNVSHNFSINTVDLFLLLTRKKLGLILKLIIVHHQLKYPYLILVNSLIPALLAGNTVILKPSPQTPTVAEHMRSIFIQAGLPEDVIQFFHSGGMNSAIAQTAIHSPIVKLVCFTGSVEGGLAVQAAASGRVVPVGLELGGKDPAYIRHDVDLDWVASEIVDGALFNSGQSCCSIERVYVHHSIHDKFIESVQKVLKTYKVGDPLDPNTHLGPVISSKSKKFIQDQIDQAIQSGSKDVTPDNSSFQNLPKNGNFIKPTLLVGVNHEMRIMREETFGPVIPVMSVKDDEEAIRLMNDSEFGLTSSIWTKDIRLAEEELSHQIESGTVFVNRCDYPSPDLAWTGWKNSGKGVTLSQFGFDQFIKLKSIHIKSYPNP